MRVAIDGREQDVQLWVPSVEAVLPMLKGPGARRDDAVVYEVLRDIASIDGEVPGYDDARALCEDVAALTSVLHARNHLYGALREQGQLHLACPHCDAGEAVLGLAALATGLGAKLPPIFDEGERFLAVPAIAAPCPRGARMAGVPSARRVRFVLPSAVGGVLRDPDGDLGLLRQAELWRRFAPEGSEPTEEHFHWSRRSAAFGAEVRTCAAVAHLGDATDVTPLLLEALSFGDFLFLDAAYHLLHDVDVVAATTCPGCGGRFQAVL